MKRVLRETRKTRREGESPLFFFTLFFLGIPAKGKEQSSVGVVYCSVIAVVNDFFCSNSGVVSGRSRLAYVCTRKKMVLDVSIYIVYTLEGIPAKGKGKKAKSKE